MDTKMSEIQREYYKELKKQLKIMCGATIHALIDTYMLMFPAAYKYENKNTFMFRYTFYAFQQRAMTSVRKLIEPSSKNKITIESIIKLATKPDFSLLSEKEKAALKADYDVLFNSEETKRIKEFRNALCHNLLDGDKARCYYNDFMFIVSGLHHILEQLYLITALTVPTCFKEARNIAEYLAANYWKALDMAAKNSNNNHDINTKLQKLLDGEFDGLN